MSRTTSYVLSLLGLIALSWVSLGSAVADEPGVVYQGKEGPGVGRHIVFVSGDEEYRSEEALPMLARILAERFGFKCTVLFAIDPETGLIDPNEQTNIPGLAALDDADLLVMFLRFRELPDADMKHIVDFFEQGKPVVALRTSTHAFNYSRNPQSPYAHWSFNSGKWQGGFGQQVLGDTWISHHGNHKVESTRGIIETGSEKHPVLRGVADVWGPTDVYGIIHLQDDATVLLRGQVLEGMKPDDKAVAGGKNEPMMPLAWVREHQQENGKKNRIFCTTMGASIDLACEDLRRLIVNSCFWCMGLDDQISDRTDVTVIGEFEPTMYGFMSDEHWREKGMKPADFR